MKRFQTRGFDEIGKDTEVRSGSGNIQLRSKRGRFASVRDLGRNEAIEAGFNCIRDFVQRGRARSHGRLAPFPAERFAGGSHRRIDLVFICLRNFGDNAAVGRIHIREMRLAGDKFPVNIVLDELHRT